MSQLLRLRPIRFFDRHINVKGQSSTYLEIDMFIAVTFLKYFLCKIDIFFYFQLPLSTYCTTCTGSFKFFFTFHFILYKKYDHTQLQLAILQVCLSCVLMV